MSFGNVIIGEDALWSSVALEYLSKKLDSWEPGSEWARRVSALAVALQPDFLLKIGGRRLPFSLFNRVHVIGDDDAFWGSTALTFFGNQIKEREPVWASTFAAVTDKVRPQCHGQDSKAPTASFGTES
jgi:hypothetical protein